MTIRAQLFAGISLLLLGLAAMQWWLLSRQRVELHEEVRHIVASVGKSVAQDHPMPRTARVVRKTSEGQMLTVDLAERTDGSGKVDIVAGDATNLEAEIEENEDGRYLVLKGLQDDPVRVPVPMEGTERVVEVAADRSMLATAATAGAGLILAALFSHAVTGQLRRLGQGADAISQGELGVEVQGKAYGEIAQLQTAFNRMSMRLMELEAERQAWRAREHLAEFGSLSRGLAHALRNPLNALGLAIEELAQEAPEPSAELAEAARGQIVRIDRWLRSFLALSTADAAAREMVDLGELVHDLALEAMQADQAIEVELPEHPVQVLVVRAGLRTALANLVDNAVEASPANRPVRIRLESSDGVARLRVRDFGAGIAPGVRERLFSPHVTTKVHGAGLGLYLARQLICSAMAGSLELLAPEGGGTEAIVELPETAT